MFDTKVRRMQGLWAPVALSSALLVLAACGGGTGTSSSSTASGTTTQSSVSTSSTSPSVAPQSGSGQTVGAGASSSAPSSGGPSQAGGLDAELAKYEKTAPLPKMDPIDASKLAGKHVEVIDCAPGAAPPVQVTAGAAEAAEAAGLDVRVTTASQTNNVTEDVQIFKQALQRKPAAIITACVSAFLKSGMAEAKQAGIPVVVTSDMEPNPSLPGQGGGPDAYAVAGQSQTQSGYLLGLWIASHGPSNAKIGFIRTDDIVSSASILDGYKAALAKYCPGCNTVYTNVSVAQWTSQLQTAAAAFLSANQDLDYLIPVLDGQTPYLVPALRAAGRIGKVHVLTTQGTVGAALGYVKSGTFDLDVGIAENEVGWQAVDQAMRGMLGLAPEPSPALQPVLVSTASLQGVDSTSQDAVYGTTYKSEFKQLWGLK